MMMDKHEQRASKRTRLIVTNGRENVRFNGGSTFTTNSPEYKNFRKSNNEASKRSKKRREAKKKIEDFFVFTHLRNLIKTKKRLNQEIDDLKLENESFKAKILCLNNLLLNVLSSRGGHHDPSVTNERQE